MTANINLNDEAFTPIGWKHPFNGGFKGAGYTISGLNVSSSTITTCGLFGQGSIFVSALHVEGNVSCTATGNEAIAGGIVGKGGGMITACSFSGTVSSTSSDATANVLAGGIVGQLDNGSIYGCYSKANSVSATGGLNPTVGALIGSGSGTDIYSSYWQVLSNVSNAIGKEENCASDVGSFTSTAGISEEQVQYMNESFLAISYSTFSWEYVANSVPTLKEN